MKGTANARWSRLTRAVAGGLACLLFVFLLQVIPHSHANGQDESACRLCQVAHLGVTPAVAEVSLDVPLLQLGSVAALTISVDAQFYFAHSPSRAPPLLGS